MDSFTHLVLGGSFAALAAPPARRRLALIAGAVIATLPDLDVFLPHADPVAAFTEHRGFTHSILVLPGVVMLLWALGQWLYAPMRTERGRWLLAIALALLTHPVVDAFTVYGTQLFWPLEQPPVMLSSIFIIDPLFTLPLLVGWIAAWRLKDKPRANFWLAVGLMASSFYLTWSWVAKQQIEQGLRASLAARGMDSAQVLTVPTPFNTMAWRLLVMSPDGDYYEGYYSFLAPPGNVNLDHYPGFRGLLEGLEEHPPVARLQWFTRGFYAASEVEGKVRIKDLRMGAEPDYFFAFDVARRVDGKNEPITPEAVPRPEITWARLKALWQRAQNTTPDFTVPSATSAPMSPAASSPSSPATPPYLSSPVLGGAQSPITSSTPAPGTPAAEPEPATPTSENKE